MKKKIIISVILISTILGIGTILFFNKNHPISLIKKINQTAKAVENTSRKTIDVTYLEDNGNLGHEHIFKTMYDENKHWEECTICREKNNEVNHVYTDKGWTLESANNCHENNVHEYVCACGYKKVETNGRKAHVWSKVNYTDVYVYKEVCNNCNLNASRNRHECINKDNGRKINCTNLGRCSLCGYNYTTPQHLFSGIIKKGENMNCIHCNTYLGIINDTYVENIQDGKFQYYTKITVPEGSSYSAPTNYTYDSNVSLSNSPKRNGNVWENTQTGIYRAHSELYSTTRVGYNNLTINGVKANLLLSANIKPENTPPTILNITTENKESLTEWSRTKPIIVSGTENYCNTIAVKILDEKENTIFYGSGGVSNYNYQIKCIPELEIDEDGKTFKAIVTDSLGNSTQQEFEISKVDCIPPAPTSSTEIIGNWAKSKDFTFTATDYGIGEVQVAFNNNEDLKLANVDGQTYSRDYTFTGDVYHEKELSVLYRDGLGNTAIQKITINKLDNTAPTIMSAKLQNNKVTITSHDEHELLGEGSGVVKYRYLASEEKIENPELTAENSIETANSEITIQDIYKMKYIYIVAEDYVGNVSKVYELEVPQLVLTSTVNLNTADGKGEIILDWSPYDVIDKYFVIYRKKENQTEWETIVPLTQKLTGNTYTDKLGNDKAKPDTPNITITGDAANNNINITATSNDNGTKYTYYIEAYDSIGTLLSKSK